jgi:hypothetical protein
MEKRLLIVSTVLFLTLATVACAGCPNVVTVSPSPTPTVSASPTTTSVTTNANPENMSAFLESFLEKEGYTIMKPLTKGTSSVTGNDIYTGTVADGVLTKKVQFEICKTVYESQSRFKAYANEFINEGYNTTSLTVNLWKGKDTSGDTALVYLDTQNKVDMLIWT